MKQPATHESVSTRIMEAIDEGARILRILLRHGQPPFRMLRQALYPMSFTRPRFIAAVGRLRQRGLLAAKRSGNILELKLTPRGAEYLRRIRLADLSIEKSKRWDRGWRFVMFDIPEKRRDARDALRQALKRLGFLRLQQSVFVQPFPCQDEVAAIARAFRVEPYVWLVIAREVAGDNRLRKHFRV